MNQLFQTVPVTTTQEAISIGTSLPIIVICTVTRTLRPPPLI